MVKGKRHKLILEILHQGTMLSTKDFLEAFRSVDGTVSESSLRRDLRDLEERGMIAIEHGCILPAQPADPYRRQNGGDPFLPEKWAIGRKAAETVHEGETIVLDSGTTVLELVRALDPKLHITCITNDLPIALELSTKPHIETIVLGGSLNVRDRALYGSFAIQILKTFHAQKVFLGTAGISRDMGITNSNLSLLQVRKEMISVAEKVVVLADSGKFEKTGFASVSPLESVDLLVTGANLREDLRQMLSSLGVEAVYA